MAVGDKIKKIRNLRGMTQKELGLAVGFSENTADVRIDQYESGRRTPKDNTLHKIATALNVHVRALTESALYHDEEEAALSLIDYVDKYGAYFFKHDNGLMSIAFKYTSLNSLIKELYKRKTELESGEITEIEYSEWKLGFPFTSDNFSKLDERKKKWRKDKPD